MASEYKVVSDIDKNHLEMSVGHWLKEGWQLAGGILVVSIRLNEGEEPDDDGEITLIYYQALFK